MNNDVRKYLATIGSRGGKKSRRKLDTKTAKNMVKLREAKKAFIKYHAQCFWSYSPDYSIELKDIPWLAQQLMKNGNHETWKIGAKLCR